MPKTAVSQWSGTAANNTDVGGIPVDGAVTTPSQVDNIVREVMAQVFTQLGLLGVKGADIASATTTNLANATGWYLNVTGTTTITGFGTVDEGQERVLTFAGILTLTHNASSLILPGAANITTAAGDVARLVSLGSGNWKCVNYQKAAGIPTIGPTTSTDNTVARYDGTAGKLQTSGVVVSDADAVSGITALSVTSANPTLTLTDSDSGGGIHVLSGNSSQGRLFLLVDSTNVGSAPLFRIDVGGTVGVFSVDESGAASISGTLTVG